MAKKSSKNKILSIDLSSQISPRVSEVAGIDYVEYGTQDWSNLYPQFLIDLYYNSSTHAAIINSTSSMIAGEGLLVEESENQEAYTKCQSFLNNVNGKESLHDVMKKAAFDYKLQGGFALNLIWNKARTEISEIYHIGVEKIRSGKPNEWGVVDTYYVSADWSDIRKHPPQEVPAFNMNDRTSPSQIIYDGDYSPNMDTYFVPDYTAACNWALVDQKISEFHLSNISNGLAPSMMVNFANGIPTREERSQIENSLIEKFSGERSAGKILLTFSDDQTKTPVVTPITVSNLDKQFLALQELLVQNILTGHRVTSPMLCGIKNNTGLGSNSEELNSAFEVYLNTVIRPYQEKILNCFGKIFQINKMNLPIEIIQNKPITTQFTLEDMKSVMTQDEIREELGLPPLESNEMVEEDEYTKMSSNQDLEDWISKHGEDIPDENWELISDEIVEDEAEEFDYEAELNKSYNIKLASAISQDPFLNEDDYDGENAQDGRDKEHNVYKVRYRYSTAISTGNSRDFCRKMISANKIYTKLHIKSMNSEKFNPGWGINGNTPYSIWLLKGGGNCGHYWRREIYFFKLGEAMGRDISDATGIIGTVEARSKGFYPKPNDPLVSQAPKNMPKSGFVNKKGY